MRINGLGRLENCFGPIKQTDGTIYIIGVGRFKLCKDMIL